jgi:hypothetical protein
MKNIHKYNLLKLFKKVKEELNTNEKSYSINNKVFYSFTILSSDNTVIYKHITRSKVLNLNNINLEEHRKEVVKELLNKLKDGEAFKIEDIKKYCTR